MLPTRPQGEQRAGQGARAELLGAGHHRHLDGAEGAGQQHDGGQHGPDAGAAQRPGPVGGAAPGAPGPRRRGGGEDPDPEQQQGGGAEHGHGRGERGGQQGDQRRPDDEDQLLHGRLDRERGLELAVVAEQVGPQGPHAGRRPAGSTPRPGRPARPARPGRRTAAGAGQGGEAERRWSPRSRPGPGSARPGRPAAPAAARSGPGRSSRSRRPGRRRRRSPRPPGPAARWPARPCPSASSPPPPRRAAGPQRACGAHQGRSEGASPDGARRPRRRRAGG